MNKKIDVEVVIGGRQYTLSGYESSEYLQKIATHINEKISALREQDGYARLETDMKNILLAINLSDDYHKAQNTIQDLRQENADMEKELFDMKHEMISMQTKLQEAQNGQKDLEKENSESEHRIIRLEAELEQLQKESAGGSSEEKETPAVDEEKKETEKKEETAPEKENEAADAKEKTDVKEETQGEENPEEVGKEIAETITKPATPKKSSRSSRKKRR